MFNPDGVRIGTSILRERIRGPALASYYPRKGPGFSDVRRMFGPIIQPADEEREDYLEKLAGWVFSGLPAMSIYMVVMDGSWTNS